MSALLSVEQAARKHGVNRHSLRVAVDNGRVRCVERRPWGASERILVSEAQLVEDLAKLPRCRATGCEETAFAASGYCGKHFGQSGRDGALKREREILNDQDRDWLTADEAAQRVGILRAAIVEKVRRRELAGEKIGRTWRIPKEAVEQLRKGRRGKPRVVMPTLDETAGRRRQVATLHRQQASVPEMAERLGVDRSTIYHDLEKLALKPPGARREARALAPKEIAELPDLYEAGRTLAELADQFDVSPGQVRDHLDGLGVPRRPSGTRPIYPLPTERRCDRCEKPFTPKSRASWDQRFCTQHCANGSRRDAYQAALTENGLLSAQEVAGRLGLSQVSIYVFRSGGALVGEEVSSSTLDRPVWGVREAELDRFCRDRARGAGSNDGRRLRWLDPDKAIEQLRSMGILERKAKKTGLSIPETETLERERTARRGKQFRRRRQGRTAGPGPPDYHSRWLTRYDELERELVDLWQQQQDDGLPAERKPSTRAICRAVALDDWAEHLDIWPRDDWPENHPGELHPKWEKTAEERVLKAVKRLQNAGTRISAG